MCPIIFQIGGLTVSGYWMMTILGFFVTIVHLCLVNRTRRLTFISWYDMTMIWCLIILSIFIGGKIMGVLVSIPNLLSQWSYYKTNFSALWHAISGNRAFYGGAIMMAVTVGCYARKNHISTETLCALYTPAISLFMVFGRLGCFLAGCCYGIEVPWGIVFPEGSLAPAGVPLFPSQLAEAFGHLLLFVWLTWLERRSAKKWPLMVLWVCCYAVMRFFLEFFRGDDARGIWLLSSSQWISLLLLAGTLVFWRWYACRQRRNSK